MMDGIVIIGVDRISWEGRITIPEVRDIVLSFNRDVKIQASEITSGHSAIKIEALKELKDVVSPEDDFWNKKLHNPRNGWKRR